MFLTTEKKLKFPTADFFGRLLIFLLLVFFIGSNESFSALNSAEFEQAKIYKKMNQTNKKEVVPSDWGGTGINLAVIKGGATLEFDCAEAEITEKMMIDKKGNFSVKGKYLRRPPGAIRVNLQPKPQPAKFVGKITGKKMMLKIMLTENDEEIGSYQLERDKIGRIRRCY